MDEIKFRDKNQKRRFYELYNEKWHLLSEDLDLLIKNVIVIFKRHSSNEDYYTLALIYWMLYFKIIDEDYKIITKTDLSRIKHILRSFDYEMKWDYKNFLNAVLEMDKELFLFKMVIKYNILSFEKKFIWMTKNPDNYYKSIWFIIPYLTYLESPFLSFFQDKYFKKVYPRKFQKIKKYYIEKLNNVEFPWEHMFMMVNNLSSIMQESGSYGITKVRRKAYFSMYNKLMRKKWIASMDNIWIRVLFKKDKHLKDFSKVFEWKYVFLEKKDYIKNPKENWYQSIHYKYISPYRDSQVLVELQLRTIEMNEQIHNDQWLNHFMYTVNENKWAKQFKEIHLWYNYIMKYIK